jgi:hypothetical protein
MAQDGVSRGEIGYADTRSVPLDTPSCALKLEPCLFEGIACSKGCSKRKTPTSLADRSGSMRGRYAMATIGRKGMVCFGHTAGTKQTFVSRGKRHNCAYQIVGQDRCSVIVGVQPVERASLADGCDQRHMTAQTIIATLGPCCPYFWH